MMKDYIENNIEIVKELIEIDNKIMHEKIDISNIIENAFSKSNLHLKNSIIYYDGNPIITLKMINSDIENCILYPNESFLAINRFIASYQKNNYLCTNKNDFKYQKVKDIFEHIIVLNDKELYKDLLNIYPNIEYIEI